MDRFTACCDLEGWFWKAEFLPSCDLPFDGAIVPFAEDCAAVGDVAVFIAAVIDDDVDTATFFLPLLDECWIGAALATGVILLGGVIGMVKSTQADGVCGLAQCANEGACLIAIKL